MITQKLLCEARSSLRRGLRNRNIGQQTGFSSVKAFQIHQGLLCMLALPSKAQHIRRNNPDSPPKLDHIKVGIGETVTKSGHCKECKKVKKRETELSQIVASPVHSFFEKKPVHSLKTKKCLCITPTSQLKFIPDRYKKDRK